MKTIQLEFEYAFKSSSMDLLDARIVSVCGDVFVHARKIYGFPSKRINSYLFQVRT